MFSKTTKPRIKNRVPKPRKRRRTPEELAARFKDGIPIRTLVEVNRGTHPADIELDTEHAAHWLGVSTRTMELWRQKGIGPPCRRGFGKAYLYRFGDLEKFKATYRKWSKKK